MTIRRREFTTLSALSLGLAACATADPAALRMEEFQVPALDPGISLYVRNKCPAAMSAFKPERTVVFVHGATYPAETAFDLALDGQSWMDYIARRGYDVWLLDLRGYGRSTRPPRWRSRPSRTRPSSPARSASATSTR